MWLLSLAKSPLRIYLMEIPQNKLSELPEGRGPLAFTFGFQSLAQTGFYEYLLKDQPWLRTGQGE